MASLLPLASLASLARGLRSFASLSSGRLYEDALYFVVDVELDPSAARAFLPAGLSLTRPARASVFVARFTKTSFGSSYDEAGILFHVRRGLRRGMFSPWMVVTDDVALVLGREVLGYPKKLADIELVIEEARLHAEVSRRGRRLLSVDARLHEPMREADAPSVLGPRAYGVRGAFGPRAQQLVTFTPRERLHAVRRATADLTVHPTSATEGGVIRDPLTSLGLGRVIDARLHRLDIDRSLPPRVVRRASLSFAVSNLGARYL